MNNSEKLDLEYDVYSIENNKDIRYGWHCFALCCVIVATGSHGTYVL